VGLKSLKSLNLTNIYPNNNKNKNNKVKSKPLELRSRVMRTIYVTAQSAPTAGPGASADCHNIKVSSFVIIGKTQLHQLTSADDDGTSLFL
jgi:hypothetical protein